MLKKYDVFHFHTKSILPLNYDAILAKVNKKKIIFHFHGCEIRLFYHGPCRMCLKINKNSKIKLIQNANKLSDKIIVSTPDLLKQLPNSLWIENSIDIEEWKYEKKIKTDDIVRIVHSPSDRILKGTQYIEYAVDQLKKSGYKVELILLENIPNTKVREFIEKADIAIDQLNVGWYGVFAIESMCMGIPTCVYIRNDLEEFAKKRPIINVNPKNLLEILRILIEDEKLRKNIGKKSRKFVRSNHNSIKNAKKIIKLYESY
ncbi:MAG: glycosyltransferase [Candidatus Aenigmatarchaeota archaeon]